jgi:transcriptional regulator with XRE-family HTH domain
MPNIDPDAKAWELDLAARVGDAVQKRRNALGMTAQDLARRTADLGYPVTRVAISKIEGNMRAGKLDVAELIVLAKALDMPPVLLLYPGYPEGYDVTVDDLHRAEVDQTGDAPFTVSFAAEVETLPGVTETSRDAVLWFAGQRPSMWVPGDKGLDEVERSVGAEMIQSDALAVETANQLAAQRKALERDDIPPEEADWARREIPHNEAVVARLRQGVKRDQDQLWGAWDERQNRARKFLRSKGVDR